jgi:hypothetical protein
MIRGGAFRALKEMELKKGLSITDIWEKMFTQDPFKAFQALAQFMPRDMMIEVTQEHKWIISHEPLTVDQWQQRVIEHERNSESQPLN